MPFTSFYTAHGPRCVPSSIVANKSGGEPMSTKDDIRKSRRQLGEVLGLAPCPAPSPRLFKAVIDAAPGPVPRPRWRQPRFAFAITALLVVAALSFRAWQTSEEPDALSEVDELAAASSLVL